MEINASLELYLHTYKIVLFKSLFTIISNYSYDVVLRPFNVFDYEPQVCAIELCITKDINKIFIYIEKDTSGFRNHYIR